MDGRIIVVADDLTGAAEIAGVAFRHGIQSGVTFETRPPSTLPRVQVINSETRLSSATEARSMLQTIGRFLAKQPNTTIFKKTDSVLRGPVRAELEALAGALGMKRVVLVPSNPALERVVQSGRYTVQGVPLHETAFAQDPHHPSQSSDVLELLAPAGKFVIASAKPNSSLPATGLIVGDAASVSDLEAWARRIPPDTLTAGSSAFFERWLLQRAPSASVSEMPKAFPEPVLLVSGTTVPAQRALLASSPCAMPLAHQDLEHAEAWTHRVVQRLSEGRLTSIFVHGPVSRDLTVAKRITEILAHTACMAVAAGMTRHLVIEGGATAAAVAAKLGWLRLATVAEWAPGIVSLGTETSPAHFVTLKPGSYPWPDSLRSSLFSK